LEEQKLIKFNLKISNWLEIIGQLSIRTGYIEAAFGGLFGQHKSYLLEICLAKS